MSKSPARKHLKLDPSASPSPPPEEGSLAPSNNFEKFLPEDGTRTSPASIDVDDEEDHCIICLQRIRDRTLLPCAHDRMCFECILVWTAQSRKCPLCNAPIGPYLIHNIRSKYDYQKRYLQPLRVPSPSDSAPLLPLRGSNGARNRARTVADRWGTRSRRRSSSRERQDMEDELELAVERRRWVYRHGLFAKHVASNPYTRYRPAPTPAQIAASPDLISRATIFIRRELRVWVNLDVEFLTTFILSLMKSLDVRSESAVKLLAEFLDMDTPYYVGVPPESIGRFRNAEQFAHELYSYLRSPFRDLTTYDSVVQYDTPASIPPAPSINPNISSRWHSPARALSARRRRRHSSPSPISHSPRDAYSRTPSPVYSNLDEGRVRYSPPPPLRSANHAKVSLPGPAKSDRGRDDPTRDTKGKGKEIEDAEAIRYPYRRDDHRSRRSAEHTSRRSSRSISPRRGAKDTLDTSAVSSRKRPVSVRGRSGENKPASDLPSEAGNPDQHSAPVLQKPGTEWGISIKGQAKLLKLGQKPSEAQGNPCGPQGSDRHDPEDRSNNNEIQNPDAFRANLDGSSTGRDVPLHDASLIDSKGVHETHNEDTVAVHLASANNDTPPPDHPSQKSTGEHRSAPEILVRTRAKIARMRGQASVAGVASTVGDGVRGDTPTALGVRARLLERLNEEKRQVSSEGPDSAAVSQSTGDDSKHAGSSIPEVETYNEADVKPNIAVEAQQAELKLRAQAQLRVRLAAERRRLEEEQTMSREDALRAKLLSRKA